jgi:DNA polymerase-3 subunit delta
VLPLLADHRIAFLLEAASICDGICKGLKHPEWPHDPWAAVQRWMLMLMQAEAPTPPAVARRAPASQ